MNTLQTLQNRAQPSAENSMMNTTHHTYPKSDRKRVKRMKSGALQRVDQDVRGHRRLGPAMSRSNPEMADGRTPKAFGGKPNEFGTIGAQLSHPTR